MRSILINVSNPYLNSNYVSKHIPINVHNPEWAKKHFRHKPYSCDFAEPIHRKEVS